MIEHISYAPGKDSTAARSALIYPGDEVYVRRAGVIYVLGAVQKPGGYLMVDGGTLSVPQAISLAQGTTNIASLKEAIIVRYHGNDMDRLVVPLRDQQEGKAATVKLQDGDMLYVPTNRVKAAFIDSQGIVSSALAATIIAAHN